MLPVELCHFLIQSCMKLFLFFIQVTTELFNFGVNLWWTNCQFQVSRIHTKREGQENHPKPNGILVIYVKCIHGDHEQSYNGWDIFLLIELGMVDTETQLVNRAEHLQFQQMRRFLAPISITFLHRIWCQVSSDCYGVTLSYSLNVFRSPF